MWQMIASDTSKYSLSIQRYPDSDMYFYEIVVPGIDS